MKYICIVFLATMCSCNQKNKPDKLLPDKLHVNTIPALRPAVNKNPVASYLIPMGDARLDRKFGVEIYETKYTFKYLLVMQYDGMVQTDTLKLPDFDTWPLVKVKPGKEKLSCIIGFIDKRNNFREYKLLSAQNNNLKLTVLHGYVVTEN